MDEENHVHSNPVYSKFKVQDGKEMQYRGQLKSGTQSVVQHALYTLELYAYWEEVLVAMLKST